MCPTTIVPEISISRRASAGWKQAPTSKHGDPEADRCLGDRRVRPKQGKSTRRTRGRPDDRESTEPTILASLAKLMRSMPLLALVDRPSHVLRPGTDQNPRYTEPSHLEDRSAPIPAADHRPPRGGSHAGVTSTKRLGHLILQTPLKDLIETEIVHLFVCFFNNPELALNQGDVIKKPVQDKRPQGRSRWHGGPKPEPRLWIAGS